MTDTYTPVLTVGEIDRAKKQSLDAWCGVAEPYMLYARAIERAAIEAYQRQQASAEAHFDLWQCDMVVASACGPRPTALAEIQHYAAVYGQDGPVQIEEVIRIPLAAPAPPPEQPT